MRILILGAGKMGSFFTDILSFQHETAVFDVNPHQLSFHHVGRDKGLRTGVGNQCRHGKVYIGCIPQGAACAAQGLYHQ